MPRTVTANGKTVQVPDDATPDEIDQITGGKQPTQNDGASSDPNAPGFVSSGMRFLSSAAGAVKDAAKGLYGAATQDANQQPSSASSILKTFAPGGPVGYDMVIKPQVDSIRQGMQMAQGAPAWSADRVRGAGHILAGLTPGVGPMIAGTADAMLPQIEQGNYAGATGTAAANAGMAYLAGKVLKGGEPGIDPVPVDEVQARKIAGAVNPPTGMQNLVEAVQRYKGDIQDYIAQKNLNVNGVLDYGKAAKMLSDDLHSGYRSLLDPIAGNHVDVPPSYQGGNANQVAQGGRITSNTAPLGDISGRIAQINELTGPANNLPTEAGSAAALSRSNMMAEKAQLADILDRHIAEAHGMQPDEITAMRQRIGGLNDIHDLAQAAVNRRTTTTANISQGARTLPEGKMGIIQHAVNSLRGGPNGIADRALRSATAPSNSSLFFAPSAQALSPAMRALLAAGVSNEQQ